ncbi:hypothetical protein HDV00_008696 [Rhizophlyctis rosea]|nr:hypothetical protein HDV00_008696 [Rhizophlyctis rosea]
MASATKSSSLVGILELGESLGFSGGDASRKSLSPPEQATSPDLLTLMNQLTDLQQQLYALRTQNHYTRERIATSDVGTVEALETHTKTITTFTTHLSTILANYPHIVNKLQQRRGVKDYVAIEMEYHRPLASLFQTFITDISRWSEDAEDARWVGGLDGHAVVLDRQLNNITELAAAQKRHADSVDALRRAVGELVGDCI